MLSACTVTAYPTPESFAQTECAKVTRSGDRVSCKSKQGNALDFRTFAHSPYKIKELSGMRGGRYRTPKAGILFFR